jgi:hypothetical protein
MALTARVSVVGVHLEILYSGFTQSLKIRITVIGEVTRVKGCAKRDSNTGKVQMDS